MTLRRCIFKDCLNFINLTNRKAYDFKLFTFPKNPERRQKWLELGKVSADLPESMYYFCSDHFDKKYMAVNNRRTILVGEAEPFPYVESENEESCEDVADNLNYCLYEINKNNDCGADNQDILVESTTMTIEMQDNLQDEQLSNNLELEESDECVIYPHEERCNTDPIITHGIKRNLNGTTIIQSEPKTKILKTTAMDKVLRKSIQRTNTKSNHIPVAKNISSLSPSHNATDEDEICVDHLVDTQRVTTFIFKGEEYVQMPKEHYINEKIEMLKKMRKMEQTINAIKGHLNDLNF